MTRLLPILALLLAALPASRPAGAQDFAVPAEAARDGALPERLALDPSDPLDLRKAVFAAAERFVRLNQTQPDLERLVLDLALDPEAAFELVRDGIASVPYSGRLRSPEAVMVAGAGNAYDKAAALGEILTRMGYDTRMVASGTARPVAPDTVCPAPRPVDPDVFLLAGLGPDILDRIATRAGASYGVLRPHLAPAAGDGPTDGAGHVWLQVRVGADWVDADPWSAANSWGDSPAADGAPMDAAPDPQAVEIRLISETLSDSRLRERDLLRSDFRLPEAAGDWITLTFGPETGGVGGILSEALGGIQGVAAPMRAVLTINGTPRQSPVFAAPGVPSGDAGFLAGDAEAVTTALWLEIRSRVPGEPDQVERRTIIDLLPRAARQRLAEGEALDPAEIATPVPGDRFPARLESIRHIVISNGGLSRRLAAARAVRDLLALPETARRADGGAPDVEALLWSTWLQARALTIASEELMRVRPLHAGGCVRANRPRVTIWGLSNAGDDGLLQWSDWTLDAVDAAGADATAHAEMRLWHGALQSALETEALMRVTLAPADQFPVETGPFAALDAGAEAATGPEAAADAGRGFLTLAGPATGAGYWWRLDPATGRADARARSFGNARYFNPWSNYVNASRGGIAHISEAELARLEADLARLGPQGFADEMGRLEDIRQAERSRKKGGGGNEYVIVLNNVSIPISVAAGTTVGIIVIGGLLVALYG